MYIIIIIIIIIIITMIIISFGNHIWPLKLIAWNTTGTMMYHVYKKALLPSCAYLQWVQRVFSFKDNQILIYLIIAQENVYFQINKIYSFENF